MIAIWPAGPPKLTKPSFSQYRNASARVGAMGAAGSLGRHADSVDAQLLRIPAVRLALGFAAPRVERVVDEHSPLQHRVIVGEHRRQSERHGEETRRLRREVERRRVGGADDGRERVERRVGELVLPDERVEAAFGPDVRIRDVRDVVGGGAVRGGERAHLGVRHVEEFSRRIDEAADEPRAGDAVDLRPRARDPAGRRRERLHGMALGLPSLEASVHVPRVEAARAQRGARSLAHLVAAHAVHDGRAPRLDRPLPRIRRFREDAEVRRE